MGKVAMWYEHCTHCRLLLFIHFQLALPFSVVSELKASQCNMWDETLDSLYAHGGVVH